MNAAGAGRSQVRRQTAQQAERWTVATPRKTDRPIYQLKVTLRGIRPPVWRRIEVPATITLAALHDVIQAVMGWGDYHLHQFVAGETTYGDRAMLEDFDVRSERTARLAQVAPAVKAKLRYEYDFGDSWEHEVVVEKILTPDPSARYPRCVAGKRACPPEDCGGVWGYANLLEAINDPTQPEHEELLEWVGGSFDPEAFDLEEVNARLQHRARS
jgi:hypothetical protein